MDRRQSTALQLVDAGLERLQNAVRWAGGRTCTSRRTGDPDLREPAASLFESSLSLAELPRFVFCAREGSVVVLDGIDGAALRELVDQDHAVPDDRRALFLSLQPVLSIEAYVEQVVARLAEAAMRLWPLWFTDVSFAMCGDNALGRQAAGVIAREAAARGPGVNASWAEAAARLALTGRAPRVAGALPAIEVAQLSRTICRTGLILVADLGSAANVPNAAALVHALEWIAHHSRAAVIALIAEMPKPESSFDRILFGARRVLLSDSESELRADAADRTDERRGELWLAPWRGAPHPMSEIEQRLAAMLDADKELAPLFAFNCSIRTVRGSLFRGDLVWTDGGLVVELDGYSDHATRRAFRGDRHRDYELMLSGFIVLRLANDEIVQDYERAIEKIRDVVRWRRSYLK